MDKFSKGAGYKISISKSVIYLYASNKQAKSKIRKIVSFIMASKIKILKNKFNKNSANLDH